MSFLKKFEVRRALAVEVGGRVVRIHYTLPSVADRDEYYDAANALDVSELGAINWKKAETDCSIDFFVAFADKLSSGDESTTDKEEIRAFARMMPLEMLNDIIVAWTSFSPGEEEKKGYTLRHVS